MLPPTTTKPTAMSSGGSSVLKSPVSDRAPKFSEGRDEDLLARLGYKQEFKRDFKRLELFGLSFTIVGVVQSIAWVPASFALGTQLTNCDPRRAVPFCFTLYPMAV